VKTLPLALAALALWAAPAAAQQEVELRRSDIQIVVHVQGSVIATDMIRLKSQIEGRVEDLDATTYTWVLGGRPLGYLANKEMAAILDSHTTTVKGVVEERWRKVYNPTPIRCPSDCFMMRIFTKSKELLKPRALLFEAAQKLQMVGRVRPEDAPYVRDGQTLEFWPLNSPNRKLKARITHYVLDIQGEKVMPGGSFTMDLSPSRYFDPGTEWEGVIIPIIKKNVLVLPTPAIIEQDGVTYVAIRISTGLTTSALTEVTAGLPEHHRVLVPDRTKSAGFERHQATFDEKALHQRLVEDEQQRAADRAHAGEKDRQKAAAAAADLPVEASPTPANAVPSERTTIETVKKHRDKAGQLPDPDATFSETPNGE
jgi:hypothetical protein